MNRALPIGLFAAFLLAGCLLPGRHGPVLLVPPLPPIVELDAEPYYFQGGYHYYYRNDSWSYSNSRNGPWMQLPRDRYPKEVRFKGRGHEQGGHDRGRDDERGRGEKRGHEGR
jgi:hypothetical protein